MAEPVLQEDVLVNFVVGDERLVAMAAKIAKNVGIIQSETEKLTLSQHFGKMAAELMKVGPLMENLAPAAIMGKAIRDTEDVLKNIKAIGASAGMTQKQFAEMNAGIAQAAAETGGDFGAIAASAKDLYGQTGLKEGLGQTILDAERLGQVFDVSGSSFSKLTASMVQLGDGAIKADDVMKSFDKTTGLTGKRMDDMLEALTDISKTMRNVVGGGKLFGESMKKITEFSGQISSQFTEMGGDGNVLNQMMKDVMDPNKWGDIAQKMPGMAGNLFDMQQAMASGDMDKFGKLMASGAQQTADMGAGMGVVARSAAGIDFASAEMLTKVDWKKMGKDASSGSDVMTRSSEMIRSVGEEWTKFMQNMSKSLMPVLMPILSFLSTMLSWMNRLMQAGDGWVGIIVTWGIIFVGLFITIQLMLKKMVKSTIEGVAEAAGGAAKGIGKGVGEGIGAMLDSIGKAASKAAAYALPMMQVGLALLFLAGAVYVLAQAMMVLSGLENLGTVALGLLMIFGAFAVFALMAIALTPVIPILFAVSVVFLIFATSVWVMAQAMSVMAGAFESFSKVDYKGLAISLYVLAGAMIAMIPAALGMLLVVPALGALAVTMAALDWAVGDVGTEMMKFAKSIGFIADAGKALEKLNNLDFSGVKKIGEAMSVFNDIEVDVSVSTKSLESINTIIDIIKKMSDNIVDIIVVGMMIEGYRPQLDSVMKGLFDAENGLLIMPVKAVNEALVHWNGNTTIPKNVMESLTGVMDLMKNFNAIFIDLAVMGQMLMGSAGVSGFITNAITFVITELVAMVQLINEKMVSFWGNTTIPKNVMESLTGVMDLVKGFSNVFVDLAVMGSMMAGGAGAAGGIVESIDTAISSIFGKDGFLNKMMDGIKGQKGDPKMISSAVDGIKGLGGLVDPLLNLTSMGALFKGGEDKNLFAFAATIGEFMAQMEAALSGKNLSSPDMIGKLDKFSASINESVKISTQTGADLALEDHTTATAEHQKTVEELLSDIRDGILSMGRNGSKEVAMTNGNVPAWRPEALFSDVSETF
jgi:hypothetical protein